MAEFSVTTLATSRHSLMGLLMTMLTVVCVNSLSVAAENEQDPIVTACENESLKITCGTGEVIRINRAMYGRFSLWVCLEKDPTSSENWRQQCFLQSAEGIINQICDGKRDCEYKVSAETFKEDPCPETRKYSEVQYRCEKASTEPPPGRKSSTSVHPTPPYPDHLDLDGSPPTPQIVSIIPANSTTINIYWTQEQTGAPLSTIMVHYRNTVTMSKFEMEYINPNTIEDGFLTLNDLEPTQVYEIYLKSMNSHGSSEDSAVVEVTMPERERIPTTTTKKPSGSACNDILGICPPFANNRTTTAAASSLSSSSATTTTSGPDENNVGNAETPICPAIDHLGLSWPQTLPGSMAMLKECPNDLEGVSYWRCLGPDWSPLGPDLSYCTSSWLAELDNEVFANVRSGQVDPFEAALALEDALMSDEVQLTPGDLKKTTRKLLPQLAYKLLHGKNADKEDVKEFEKAFVTMSSELLSEKNGNAWQELSRYDRGRAATSLTLAVEDAGFILASTMNAGESRVTAKENVVMKVSRVDTQVYHSHLSFSMRKDVRTESPLGSSSDLIIIPSTSLKVAGSRDLGNLSVVFTAYNNLEQLLEPQMGSLSMDQAPPSYADRHSESPGYSSVNRRAADGSDASNPTAQAPEPVIVINSRLIGASMQSSKQKRTLPEPVQFTLEHLEPVDEFARPLCSFWDVETSRYLDGKWSQEGCVLIATNETHTVCECDHLTNFAVLMDISGVELTAENELALRVITYVGCIISIVCLIMAWITFTIFKNLQCDRNTIHKNLVLTLLLAESLFVGGIAQTQPKLLCTIVAIGLHFFFLSAFAWMCLEGIQLYVMLVQVFEQEKSRVTGYYLFGYGIPVIVVGVSAAIYHQGYGTDTHCWLSTERYFILSFVGPALAVMLINVVMLSIAIYTMCRHSNISATLKERSKAAKFSMTDSVSSMETFAPAKLRFPELPSWLKGATVLVVLLGLTWSFGLLYLNQQTVVFAYIFTVLNSLQGLFIFFFHCIKNEKVQKEYRKVARQTPWLPDCIRVNYGGHSGRPSSSRPVSSGSGNYLSKLFRSRRKRADISTNSSAKPFLSSEQQRKSDTSNCNSHNSASRDSSSGMPMPQPSPLPSSLNGYVYNPSYAQLNNGYPVITNNNRGSAGGNGVVGGHGVAVAPHMNSACTHQHRHHLAPCYEEVVGELSQVIDCSVVDSEMVTEYCQHNMQVTQEKLRYSTGSEDSNRLLPPLPHHPPPYLDPENLSNNPSTASLASSHGRAPSPAQPFVTFSPHRTNGEEPVYEEVKSENGDPSTLQGGLNLRQYIISNSRSGWTSPVGDGPSDTASPPGSPRRSKARGSLSSGAATDTASPEKSSSSPDLQFLPGFSNMSCTNMNNGSTGHDFPPCPQAGEEKVRSPRLPTQEIQHSLPDLPPAGLAPVPGTHRFRYIDPSDPASSWQHRHASETDVQLMNSDC